MINQEKYRSDLQPELYKEGKYSKTLLSYLKDYILSSGEAHSIREFVEKAFLAAGLEGVWHGNGENEEYSLTNNLVTNRDACSSVLVKINPKFYRPAEVELLLGDSSEARQELGWSPKSSFSDLVNKMVKHDISLLTNPR